MTESFHISQAQQMLLDVCAKLTRCAVGFYRSADGVAVFETSPPQSFERYCQAVHSLKEGRRLCQTDHIRRAREVIEAGEPMSWLCHAGLFNCGLPVMVDGCPESALLYGQMLKVDHWDFDRARGQHERFLESLDLNEEDELSLRAYHDCVKHLTPYDETIVGNMMVQFRRLLESMIHEQIRCAGLTAVRSHGLHVVVSSIRQLADLLPRRVDMYREDRLADTPLVEAMEAVKRNALELETILATPEYPPPEWQLCRGDLTRVLHDAAQACEQFARSRGVRIELQLHQPVFIDMWLEQLRHAFFLLLHNAVQYSYYGTAGRLRTVEVEGRRTPESFQIVLSNYGIGILPEELERVFDPGFRGTLALREDRSGSGVGLWLAKRIVDEHHGGISVKSRPIQGGAFVTSVEVELPLRQPQSPESQEVME